MKICWKCICAFKNSSPEINILSLGVCDIEKNLDILGDFFDNDNWTIFCIVCNFANI